jgi:tRNA pseudouridine55 synthase
MDFDFEKGSVLPVNKPIGWTSFDVVNKVRYLIKGYLGGKVIKVGHAGTLDPLADGLLIIMTGKFTKRIDEFQLFEKEYTGIFYLGQTTPSYDLEHAPDQDYPTAHITEEMIRQCAAGFVGDISQIPPVYSAVKHEGKRAYLYARKNKEIEIQPKQVNIREFEITRIEMPRVHFRISCSKGTYIRSIARDLGEALQSGAYLEKLSRTRIGEYRYEDALSVDYLESILHTHIPQSPAESAD